MPEFPCRHLLIGVSGSVGSIIVPHFIYALRQRFAEQITVLMSHAAQRFITPYTFRLFTDRHVFTDTFEITDAVKIPHISLVRQSDLFAIMPATANMIGKVANGICDDLISTSAAACEAPVVFVPSMNASLWEARPVQHNIRRLRRMGYHVLEPGHGYELADMQPTFGVMPPFADILEALTRILGRPAPDEDSPDAAGPPA